MDMFFTDFGLIIKLLYNISIIIMFSVAFSCSILDSARKEQILNGVGYYSLAIPLLVVPIFIMQANYSLLLYVAISTYIFTVVIPVYNGFFNKLKSMYFTLYSVIIGVIISIFFIGFPDFLKVAFSSFLISFIALGLCVGTIAKKIKSMPVTEALPPMIISTMGVAVYFIRGELFTSIFVIAAALASTVSFFHTLSSHRNTLSLSDGRYYELKKRFDSEVEKAVKEKTIHLQRAKDIVVEKNKTDELTGALNRRALMVTIEDLVLDKRVPKFVMMIFDLDKFKTINDTYGHNVGDKCLKTLAGIAKTTIRDYDYFARYGGDEFIIILPNASLREGILIADRFRKRVADETFEPNFTLSIGLAAYPWDGEKFKDLNEVADKGLYAAKSKGRNCVQYAGTLKPDSI